MPGMPVGDRVVRWELRNEQVLLRDVKYAIRADVKDSVRMAVEATSLAPIIRAFPVKAWGKDKSAVIEVTVLFTSDVTEFSPQRELNASGIDSGRTFLEEVKAFPNNLETKVLATFRLGGGPPGEVTPRGERTGARRDPTQSAVTVLLHHSMMILPENPMAPRVFDERVGFFTVGFEDYGDIENHQVENVRFITRWRLEKQDPNAAVSEPKQPIVFYVGREVPDKWKEYVKKGHRSVAAGFREGRLQERDHRQDGPRHPRGSQLGCRRCPHFVHPLVAVHHGKRLRAARARSAERRDPGSGRADLPQRHETGPRLVFRASFAERSAALRNFLCPTKSWANCSRTLWPMKSDIRSASPTT